MEGELKSVPNSTLLSGKIPDKQNLGQETHLSKQGRAGKIREEEIPRECGQGSTGCSVPHVEACRALGESCGEQGKGLIPPSCSDMDCEVQWRHQPCR